MKRLPFWMGVSGFLGFSFFLIANFTSVLEGLSITAACIQIVLNAFVFVVWLQAYRVAVGFKKLVAWFGVAIPAVMASVTIYRVLLPALFQ